MTKVMCRIELYSLQGKPKDADEFYIFTGIGTSIAYLCRLLMSVLLCSEQCWPLWPNVRTFGLTVIMLDRRVKGSRFETWGGSQQLNKEAESIIAQLSTGYLENITKYNSLNVSCLFIICGFFFFQSILKEIPILAVVFSHNIIQLKHR